MLVSKVYLFLRVKFKCELSAAFIPILVVLPCLSLTFANGESALGFLTLLGSLPLALYRVRDHGAFSLGTAFRVCLSLALCCGFLTLHFGELNKEIKVQRSPYLGTIIVVELAWGSNMGSIGV